jgi:AcrR family transcriptional regulator
MSKLSTHDLLTSMPRLRIGAHTARYPTGRARIYQILETAVDLLIAEGYHAVTLRELARRCDISVGTISYYYKSKEELARDLIQAVINPYLDVFGQIIEDDSRSAETKLIDIVHVTISDIGTEKTSKLFPELWALSNHDPFVAEQVEDLYAKVRNVYKKIIAEINPNLNDEIYEVLALFMSASLEGSTIFIGHGKRWSKLADSMTKLYGDSFLMLLRNLPKDISGL